MSPVTQKALRNGHRRALDPMTYIPSKTVQVDLSSQPTPYCMTDKEAQEALARRRTPPPPNNAPSYADAHLIDRMWNRGQFNDRQHDTAVRLYGLFVRAGLEPRVVGEIGERAPKAAEMEDGVSAARTTFNRILACVAPPCAELLHAMCLGHHPGVQWLATLQAALGDVEKPLMKAFKKDVDGVV